MTFIAPAKTLIWDLNNAHFDAEQYRSVIVLDCFQKHESTESNPVFHRLHA